MIKFFTRLFFIGSCILMAHSLLAQCPTGYTQAELNWDHIDFLPSNNTRYTTYYPSSAFPYTQNFTIGTRSVNFTMAPQANIVLNGENVTNTAHAGSFATDGADVQFTTTSAVSVSTVVMNFNADVANVRFSIFDLDVNQRVNITATNTVGVAQTITIVRANATSAIIITGSGGTSVTATGPGTNYPDNNNNGTINITIAGPVRRIVSTLSNASGDLWLSDIAACVTGSFPNNYQIVSRPFTNQAQYVLTVVNNNIYYTDPTNGRSYFLFNEPGHDRLNSMAYDPYRRIVYYTYSLTERAGLNPRNDKTLKKYDVDSKTISVVIPNVNTFGIPTYESGVESGAATFYNGSLYLGIEGYTGEDYAASRKSTIWKIDFDVAGNPIAPASQVWGVLADDGTRSQNIHDWSDFGITNGRLIDFDGSISGDIDYYHIDLMTGVETNYTPVGPIPRQVSIGWDENVYNVDAAISMYNGTNGMLTPFTMTAPLGPTISTGSGASWGDAAGPYRPFLDFGDAPATYDPDPLAPACHDTLTPTIGSLRTRMRLGPNEDVEWLKKGLTSTEDNFEDGLAFVPIFAKSSGVYTARVTTFNNTGANANLRGWLDFNGNGVFDAGEASNPITVGSLPGVQTLDLFWPSTPSTLPNGSFTYLRIRIAPATTGMNAANATGYYDIGEVEDYRVLVDDFPLSVTVSSFDAAVINKTSVQLKWTASEDVNFMGYDIQRSRDGAVWESVSFVEASHAGGIHDYTFIDRQPFTGRSYYRLQLTEPGVQNKFSATRMVTIKTPDELVSIYPNPVLLNSPINITIMNSTTHRKAIVAITGVQGSVIQEEVVSMQSGMNNISVPVKKTCQPGTYLVSVVMGEDRIVKKIVIK